ncbi:uncharacterized protein LOC141628812 [Silene latifolia]|uniref:uncharacterized protein LOC141628812 n=1 Tax=Silene latifolia TaxID=37657 RepID=UPI003D77E661
MEGRVLGWMNAILGSDYREEEVTDALNQIHPLKAPGPDRMNGLFYQTYWHIVGPMVISTVLGVLCGDQMPAGMNHTHIVLIPKKKAPDKIRDFRPISLCNVVYKLVSKVLANRLKPFLNDIVSENQSAFTAGRLISDNVLIAFELFHHMKNLRHGEGFMAIKLDMAKAYDRVEWDFLEAVLRGMGFDRGWVDRVMMCVSSVLSAVLINGNAKEVFRPERGLRQGDPLSPYLFILCAEVLSNQMRRAVMSNSLHGIRIAPNASEEEAERVCTILRRYEEASANICDEPRSIVSRFWWGCEEGNRRISWVAWKRLCRPKDMGGLGFRDFFKMNQALLGKPAWRLLTSQNCLWARLMQSKYYHGKSFLDAEFGGNPSYTWHGIIGAREVLLKGLRRRIGEGRDTFVLRDAWIPATQTGKVVSPCVGGNAMMRVAELMTDDGRAWNEKQLNTVLMSFEQERVRNIRLSNTTQAYSWYWSCERDGNYSVKSAYRLLDGIDLSLEETSNWAREKWIWKKLWKTRVVFEGGGVEVERVIKRVRDIVEEINSGYEERKKEVEEGDNRQGQGVDDGWRAPSPGWVKLNVDAGVKEGIGVGVGAVCRDEMGRVLWGLARHRKEVWEPRVAEEVALLDGIEEAVKAGHENLVVESDCSQLIEALKAHKTGRSPFFLVLDDIHTLCSSFSSISWSYTSRKNNKVAHALAYVLPSVVGNSVWIGTLPEAVNRFLD